MTKKRAYKRVGKREPEPPFNRLTGGLLDGAKCDVCGATLVTVTDATGLPWLLHPHQISQENEGAERDETPALL